MSWRKVEPHPYTGFQREGQPKGRYYGVDPRYHVLPGDVDGGNMIRDREVGLLFLSDKLGICYDSLMLADQYAATGIVVVMPSYTGVATPPNRIRTGTTPTTKTVQHSEAAARKIIDDAIKSLVGGEPGSIKKTRIVLVGYGCGAKHVLRLLAQPDTPKGHTFIAGLIASPEGDPAVTLEDYGKVTKPISIAFAEDPRTSTAPAERERIRDALKVWAGPYQINLYSHARDGFAVRRAVASKAEVYAKRQAFVQSLQWFHFHLFENN